VSVKSIVLNDMPEFRKETNASITYAGSDRARALPNVVNVSGTARNSANNYSQSFSTFNYGSDNLPKSSFGAYAINDFTASNSPTNASRTNNSLQQIS